MSGQKAKDPKVRPFLFDRTFDPEEIAKIRAAKERERLRKREAEEAERRRREQEEANKPPPEPTFTKTELKAAEDKARAEGETAGAKAAREQAQQAAETKAADALTRLGGQIDGLVKTQQASDQTLQAVALQIGTAIGRRLFPLLADRGGLIEVEAAIEQVLRTMVDEARITIRLAPDMADLIQDRVRQMVSDRRLTGTVEVRPDPDLATGDFRIHWNKGGAERLSTDILRRVDAAVLRAIGADDPSALTPPAEIDQRPGPVTRDTPESGTGQDAADMGQRPAAAERAGSGTEPARLGDTGSQTAAATSMAITAPDTAETDTVDTDTAETGADTAAGAPPERAAAPAAPATPSEESAPDRSRAEPPPDPSPDATS